MPHGGTVDQHLVAWIMLAVAALADGSSLRQTSRQARREAGRSETTLDYLRHSSDPTLRVIAVEDAAALVGVGIAAVGILAMSSGGQPSPTRSPASRSACRSRRRLSDSPGHSQTGGSALRCRRPGSSARARSSPTSA